MKRPGQGGVCERERVTQRGRRKSNESNIASSPESEKENPESHILLFLYITYYSYFIIISLLL